MSQGSHSSTPNSSPPSRAAMSVARSSVLQALADLAQQLVARVVAERVVELLEVVEVEQQQRHARVARAGRDQAVAQAPQEVPPVGHRGELVGERLPARFCERAHVAEGQRHAREGGDHREDGERQRERDRGG